ncbi:serine/threonine-protein phosphatase 2A regulatory subunit B'' subunit beta isoform X2 [Nematostella vectensis]|uniref:serine/threonine-protein phosphatase 2A regulatory subunit B'' subunit beta isoform X2 n=1 Tax=Nematostella vectensis TaxID=45351 RepID=UPI002076E548|nr:serine/threonine-protein phosphatase 2A regulatory subunit B'' subunit beta isoform X2 [Nematostella vectensis]
MTRMAVTPLLKAKVDELFLRWLSMPETQKILHEDLERVIEGRPIAEKTDKNVLSNLTVGSSRSVSPPAPSSSPTPSRSPRSPRDVRALRKSGTKTPPISPRLERHGSGKNLMKEHVKIDLNGSEIREGCAANIPQFYFPNGPPPPSGKRLELTFKRVSEVFGVFEGGKAKKEQFSSVTKACNLPLYWKQPLFACAGGNKNGFVTLPMFTSMWRRVSATCHDDASRFVRLLAKPGRSHLDSEDFVPLIQDIVQSHPGLSFLEDAPEFHSRYVHTVIARIFYSVNSSWTGKITIPEVLASLEEEEDINEVLEYFSYEHFYVIYCKFWELDTDHDLLIDEKDLCKHSNHALSSRMVKRLFSGCVTRGKTYLEGKMTYPKYVWFLLSEEDKKHPRSIEYWFRCMDLDGDGVLSMYELEYFYEEQVAKMDALGIETMAFEDCLCQILDMVKPKTEGKITLTDLKNCKMAFIFFNTFFNLDKYLEFEQRDPFGSAREVADSDLPPPTDWERYAQEEYELLVAEEGAAEQCDGYEDDFEEEELQEFNAEDNILSLKGLTSDEEDPKPWGMVTGIDEGDDDKDDDDDFNFY